MKVFDQQRLFFLLVVWLLSITITGCLSSLSGEDSSSYKDPIGNQKHSTLSSREEISNTSRRRSAANPDRKATASNSSDNKEGKISREEFLVNKESIAEEIPARNLPVYGYVENILLGPRELKLKAKLDSGAHVSSLGAIDLVEFERDGKKWVRFNMVDPSTGKMVEFEKKIERHSRIKQHLGQSQRRPVVLMDVKLGNNHIQREFNLGNRQNFIYKVLLGRNFLDGIALIDVSKTFQAKTSFSDQKE